MLSASGGLVPAETPFNQEGEKQTLPSRVAQEPMEQSPAPVESPPVKELPRLRDLEGAWTKEQVAEWSKRVREWAREIKGLLDAWALVEGHETGFASGMWESLFHVLDILRTDPYNLGATVLAREHLTEVKWVCSFLSYGDESKLGSRLRDASFKAGGFQEAFKGHWANIIFWYRSNLPQPEW